MTCFLCRNAKKLFFLCLLLCLSLVLFSCSLFSPPAEDGSSADTEPQPQEEPEKKEEPEPQFDPEPEPVSLFADLGKELVLTEDYYAGLIDEPYFSGRKALEKIDLGGHILDLCGLSLTVASDSFVIQNGVLANGSLTVRAEGGKIVASNVQFSKAGFHAEADSIELVDAACESMATLRAEKLTFTGEKTEIQSYSSVYADEVTVNGAACPLPAGCRPAVIILSGSVDVSVCSAVPLIRAVGTEDGSLTLRRGADVKFLTGENAAELTLSIQPGANLLAVAADADCHIYSERKVSYMPDAAVDYLAESLDAEAWDTVPEMKKITVGEMCDKLATLVGAEKGRDLLPFYLRWAYDSYRYDTVDYALEEIGVPENRTLTGLMNDYYAYFVLASLLGDKSDEFFAEYGDDILAAIEAVDWGTVGSNAENFLGAVVAHLNEETDWLLTEEDDVGTLYRFDEVAFVRTLRDYRDRSAASLIFEIAGMPTEDAEQIVSDLVPLLKRFPNTKLSNVSLVINMMVSVIGLDFEEAQTLRTGIYDAMDALLSAIFGYEISFRDLCRENGDQTLYEVLAEKENVDTAELAATFDGSVDWLEKMLTSPLAEIELGSSNFYTILDLIIEEGEKTDITFRIDENNRLYLLKITSEMTDDVDAAFSYVHLDGSPISFTFSATTVLGDVSFSAALTEKEVTFSSFVFGTLYRKTYQIPDLLLPKEKADE